jgi:1,4-alpha-glucan branching enzyme
MARMCSSTRPIEFKLYAPQARRVNLAGSFNNWNTQKPSAKKDSRGNWMVKVDLRPGRYEYKFLVDGSWFTDPKCTRFVSNPFGSQNCVVEVS